MKVVFLDIDGVLCTDFSFYSKPKTPFPPGFHIPFRSGWDGLEDSCIDCLNKITDETGANIVVSSTWRSACKDDLQFQHLTDYLHSCGVKANIIGRTPQSISGHRGREIKRWLDEWSGESVSSFVILDDGCDIFPLLDYHVQTAESIGLDDESVSQSIRILDEKTK